MRAELIRRGVNPDKIGTRGRGYCPHNPTSRQADFLALPHREAFYGGAAGGGKSDALLMDALAFVDRPGYAALVLRKTFRDLNQPDAIMSRAKEWLIGTDAAWNSNDKRFTFPNGATITFGYLEKEDDIYQYQGARFHRVYFDELAQFSESQYLYLHSRVRKAADEDIPLAVRAASNPGGKGHEWVKARFVNPGHPDRPFIRATLEDNPHLDQAEYMESLGLLDHITRAQLLSGDWDAIAEGGLFKRQWFRIVEAAPLRLRLMRFWDLAATEVRNGEDPDWTVGALCGLAPDGYFYILDVQRDRTTPLNVERIVRSCADVDGRAVAIRMEQEPGSSGVNTIDNYTRKVLQGFDFRGFRSSGPKEEYARPLSAQFEAGNVFLVRGAWNEELIREFCAFPTGGIHDDQVDAVSKCFAELCSTGEVARDDDVHRVLFGD